MAKKEDELFPQWVIDALPENADIKRGIGAFNRSQNPDWIRHNKEAAQKRVIDPEWQRKHREGIEKKALDPEWREQNKQRYNDPEWQRKVIEGTAKRTASPEWQKNHLDTIKRLHADPEFQEKHKAGIAKRTADPEWKRKNNEQAARRRKPISTPAGSFEMVSDAALFYGLSNEAIRRRTKTKPDEYFYITKEEYDALPDNDVDDE